MISDLLTLVDGCLAELLSDTMRLICWAIAAGISSMGLYVLVSPQHKLKAVGEELAEVRSALARYHGDFAGACPLIRRSVALAVRRLALVTGPSFVAGVPVVAVLVWMGDVYAHRLPEAGDTVVMHLEPAGSRVTWEPTAIALCDTQKGVWHVLWPRPDHPIYLRNARGRQLVGLPLATATPELKRWKWWNLVFANPAGYLPGESRVEKITIQYPRRTVLSFGPPWARSWLTAFLTVTCLAAVVTKWIFRIV
jgi:hypothetical protein